MDGASGQRLAPEPAPVAGRRRGVPWPAVCGVLAALLQLDFLLQLVLPSPFSLTVSQISELSTPAQPHAWVFRACDVATGVVVLALVPGWWRVSRTVGGCLAAYGVGLAVAALWVPSCDDSLDPTCPASRLPGAATSLQDDLHDLGSVVSTLAVLLGALVAAVLVRRAGDLGRGRLLLVLAVGSVVVGLVETAEDVGGVHTARGIAQRLQITLLSAVLVLLADPSRWPRAGAWRRAGPR